MARRINLKKQIIIVTTFIALLCVAIVVVIIIPATKEILSLNKSITETQKFLEEEYEKTQRMRRSVYNLDAIIEQTEKFKKIIVQKGDELKIITELEQLALDSDITQNLRVEQFEGSGGESIGLNNNPYYIFSFVSTGNFNQLMKYLKSLEQMPYYFNINSLKFTKKGHGDSLELQFNAKLYITN